MFLSSPLRGSRSKGKRRIWEAPSKNSGKLPIIPVFQSEECRVRAEDEPLH